MDDDEGRAQPGSPEARDSSLEEQKPPGDDIAAPEADDVASGTDLEGGGPHRADEHPAWWNPSSPAPK